MLTKCQTLCEHETADKIIMLLNVKRIMFVNMFYFSSLLFGD